MKLRFLSRLTLIILPFMITVSLYSQTNKTKTMTKEQLNVLSAIENMTLAFQNKNIDRVMASYEPGAVVVFEPEKPISDENVLREMFIQMSMLNPIFTYSGHEVFISGNIATHISPWQMTAKTPDGKTITQSGLSVAVLRKQSNGEWLMIMDNPHGQFLMDK